MTTTVPIQLAVKAARLDLWTECEAMIEHTSQVVPEAQAVTVLA
ncbi:MAG: hypothetical protein ABI353_07930 [Isosphaeraceae bacterium]